VYPHDLARAIHLERQHEIESCLRVRAERRLAAKTFGIAAFGRALIRVGSLLAAEGPSEVGQVRSPGPRHNCDRLQRETRAGYAFVERTSTSQSDISAGKSPFWFMPWRARCRCR